METVKNVPHQDTVTPQPPAIPWLPENQHLTPEVVARMIDSRINIAFDEYERLERPRLKRAAIYKAVGIGVGGAAVGVGGTLIVSRIIRGRRARTAAMK